MGARGAQTRLPVCMLRCTGPRRALQGVLPGMPGSFVPVTKSVHPRSVTESAYNVCSFRCGQEIGEEEACLSRQLEEGWQAQAQAWTAGAAVLTLSHLALDVSNMLSASSSLRSALRCKLQTLA